MMLESIIKFESVCKNYGNTHALTDLTFNVAPQSIFGFLGPNGAGKSTTIKIMMGLRRLSAGKAYVLGNEVKGRNPDILSRIGYVPESESLYSAFTARQIIDSIKPYYPKWDKNLEKTYLEKFELPSNKRISEYSLGMKRKLQLLLALSCKPELLIMDEPTLGLDPITRYKFLQTLVSEVAQGNMTIFMSSHNLSEVERICDTVAFIKNGKLLELKKIEELKKKGQRMRVVFQKDIPASALDIPGIEMLEGSGKHYTFSISGDASSALEELNKLPIFVMEDLDLSLEDIFIRKMEEK